METLTTGKMATTNDGGETREELSSRILQQFQCRTGRGWSGSICPDGIDFGHVDRAVERGGPVCPCPTGHEYDKHMSVIGHTRGFLRGTTVSKSQQHQQAQ